jgi:hypothetical protein
MYYWVNTWGGNSTETAYIGSDSAPGYTSMVDGTLLAQVCMYSGFDDLMNCSGWH